MFQLDTEGFDVLLNSLNRMDVEEIAEEALEKSADLVQDAVKKETEKHRDTGAMLKSVKKTKVEKSDTGYQICVRPTGKDAKGVRNMEKFAYLEYGTSTQKATPVLTPALRKCEKEVLDQMQEVFNTAYDNI